MNFIVDINDKRLFYVKEYLSSIGKRVIDFNGDFKKVKAGDCIVLSPAYKWTEEKVKILSPGVILFTGNMSDECQRILAANKVNYYNFMADEDFVLKNANYTAEGFLADLISHTDKSIFDLKILILGSGRVAKAVGYLFYKLGLNISFAMRNEKEYYHMKLFANNCYLWDEYKKYIKEYDVIINTIPAMIFNQEDLALFNQGTCVFELASIKCLDDSNLSLIKYVFCPALPSKYMPESAGKLIADQLSKFLEERK